MANQWFKFYGAEYLSDPKMDRLTVQERSCWLTLLCMASQSNGTIKYLSTEGLLNKSGVHFDPYDSSEWDNALGVLKTFEKYEMITVHENGSVEIKNWEKRQEHNLTNAERQAKYRENRKSNAEVTDDVTKVTLEENRIEENRNTIVATKVAPTPSLLGKSNTNTEDTEPTVEADEDTIPTSEWAKRDAKKKGYKGDLTNPLLEWAEKRMGKRFPVQLRQKSAISRMTKSGYTTEKIKQMWEILENDKFWSEKGIDFSTVESQIGKHRVLPSVQASQIPL